MNDVSLFNDAYPDCILDIHGSYYTSVNAALLRGQTNSVQLPVTLEFSRITQS